jgi:parvulin-like peptidyl-prolyl isomerase
VCLGNLTKCQNRFWIALLLLLLSVQGLCAADSTAVKKDRQLLAVVGTDSIYTSDVDAVFSKMHEAMSAQDKANFDYRKLLDKLINDRLIKREAEAVGIADDSTFKSILANRERDYAVRAFIAARFVPEDSLSHAEILSYFLANYYSKQVRTVSVATQQEAARLLNLVRKGASMDSIARAVSLDIYRYQGGLHRLKYVCDLEPELREQLANVKDGGFVGPFPNRQVFAFLRLEKTVPADTAELTKFETYIRSILQTQKKAASWKRFVTNLRRDYRFRIDSVAYRAILSSGRARLDSAFLHGTGTTVVWVNDSAAITDSQLRKRSHMVPCPRRVCRLIRLPITYLKSRSTT